MANEKDPKDYFVQPLRCPRTANGNTKRVLVVYSLTNGVHVVYACEYEGAPSASLADWAGGDASGWEGRLGEVLEVPAKVAKEYLERSRKLALRAIDAATKSVTFTRDCSTMGPYAAGEKIEYFCQGDRISVTDYTEQHISPLALVRFTYRGHFRTLPLSAVVVST